MAMLWPSMPSPFWPVRSMLWVGIAMQLRSTSAISGSSAPTFEGVTGRITFAGLESVRLRVVQWRDGGCVLGH